MSRKKLVCMCVAAAFCRLEVTGETDSQIIGYDDSHPSNLVAVVVGYQNIRRHESGIDIPVFSVEEGAGAGRETGILFYIVAPTNHAGHFFFVECPRGYSRFEDQPTPSEILFPKDQLFSFRLSDAITRGILESKDRTTTRGGFTTWHLTATQYHWSTKECESYLAEKRELEEKYKRELPALKERLNQEKQAADGRTPKTDAFKALAEDVRHRINALVYLPVEIKEAEEQLERLRNVRETEINENDRKEATGK